MFDRTLQGRRVRLIHCDDPDTRIVPGSQGTVRWVDDAGTLHVTWDTGETLGLIVDLDRWELL